jgi:hypothetical protein
METLGLFLELDLLKISSSKWQLTFVREVSLKFNHGSTKTKTIFSTKEGKEL